MKGRRFSVLAALAVAVAACSPGTASPGPSSTAGASQPASVAPSAALANIWYVSPLVPSPAWTSSAKLFTDGAAAGGYKATVVGPDKIDIPAMVSNIEQAMADGADGIITCSLDPAGFKSVFDQAQSAGIIVASIGCVDDNADFSVGTDNADFGKVAADFIAAATNNNGQVGIVRQDATAPNQIIQLDAFNAQLAAKYPDMKVVGVVDSNADVSVVTPRISALVQANPGMNYVWIIEGAAPGAIPAAFREAGLEPGQVGVLAIDAQDTTLQAIEDGWISASLNQCWFDAAPQIAKRIIEAMAGTTQPQFIAIPVDPVSKERLPYAGCPPELTAY